jgi:hypothetical protein
MREGKLAIFFGSALTLLSAVTYAGYDRPSIREGISEGLRWLRLAVAGSTSQVAPGGPSVAKDRIEFEGRSIILYRQFEA